MSAHSYAPAPGSVRSTIFLLVATAILLLGAYFLLLENGSLLSPATAEFLHEATHDARHALGVPCH
ncbi:CbtB-domain containing protein [Arthrobacter sp. AB6]|uniref:CbtB domain-containing protein n=1 Tax=Arthrobacter sp. AB6 TaxID=2962570 RepID=UPI002881D0A1|nr:CbtB-domain containing protein [Arthrobacter sp. AB6]MDT0196689.1 CbtB-domain containing protein [Arthrobacter sp. AB6]